MVLKRDLITTNDLTINEIENIFNRATEFLDKKNRDILIGKKILTIFFENSTRTKSSFEIASKRLGADVINLDVSKSSTSKGETLYDTALNLDSMAPDAIIVRHQYAGVPKKLAQYTKAVILNAGDGAYAHPTQALLDLFTIQRNFNIPLKNLAGKRIALVGDVKNSRVANSNITLLKRFNFDITVVSPPHFMPNRDDIKKTYFLKDIIDNIDVIMSLRTQTERHSDAIYGSLNDYAKDYCITSKLLKDKDILLLHPGPVHRNIDISDSMLNDKRCKILEQVENGVAIRMAILEFLLKK